MKRNNLTSAIVAGIAGVAGVANMAGAVNLNPDGLGQVLVYPYYTVNNNNNTLISVVNTHNEGKAVKVRFLEGFNSREVLDFNLYLSPFDVWVAAVFSTGDANSVAGVVTDDNSCTVPPIKTNAGLPQLPDGRRYAPFRNAAYSDIGNTPQGQNNDTGPEALSRTREGHIEMIEMAVITDETEESLTALTHVDSVPADCGQLVGAWSPGGYWTLDPTIDTDLPTGGLFGAGSIVNAPVGIILGYNADAVDHFRDNVNHAAPGTTDPKLSDAETDAINGIASAFVFDSNNAEAVQANGGLVRADYASGSAGIDAVSAVFASDNLFNEYNVDTASGASSEWVITFPTKRFYVDQAIVGATTEIPPFVETFGENVDGKSCVQVGLLPFDREENPPGSCANGGVDPSNCIDFSPPIPGVDNRNVFCYEAQVVTFLAAADFTAAGGVSPVLGSRLTSNVDLAGVYGNLFTGTGWMQIDLDPGVEPHAMRPSTDGDVFHGLPVTGFLAQNFINNNVTQGVLSNYSALYRHRFSRACTNGVAQAACS